MSIRPQQHDHDRADSSARPRTFAGKVLVAASISVAILALAVFLWYSIQVLLLMFAGVLIAILLRGLSDWVSDLTRLPHAASLAIVLLLACGIIFGIFWFSAPSLTDQMLDLLNRLPQAVQTLHDRAASTRLGQLLLRNDSVLGKHVQQSIDNLLGDVKSIVLGTISLLVGGLVVFFTGLFLSTNPRLYVRGVVHLVPPGHRDRIAEVLGAIGYTLKWWLIGQAIDMVVIGTATAIGLWLLGVPLALVLGFITGIFNFIPNFGPLFGLIPAVLLTLPKDPNQAIYVVLLFIVLQNLEGYLLMPFIQGRATKLPGALTLTAQVLMGILAGGLGLALAAPLAAATMVAVKMLYVEDLLGDRIKTPADHDARQEVKEVKRAAAEVARERKGSD